MKNLVTVWEIPSNATKGAPTARYEYDGWGITRWANGTYHIDYQSPMTLYSPNHIHKSLEDAISFIDKKNNGI